MFFIWSLVGALMALSGWLLVGRWGWGGCWVVRGVVRWLPGRWIVMGAWTRREGRGRGRVDDCSETGTGRREVCDRCSVGGSGGGGGLVELEGWVVDGGFRG
ncbi:hypothetical protein F4801DRAFT_533114 [Xylaria longipes]|nr:hypothetical protein F4801DRAFT_533114 [Xylaria longipes]